MEIATLTGRRSGPDVARPEKAAPSRRVSLPAACLALLVLGTLVGFIVYPTFPNYDSYYSLLWGRELLHGVTPSFEAYRAPTEHPLAIVFGAVLSLLGDPADRVMVGFTLAAFVALAAGLYRLGRAAFTPVVGLVAGALVCTRFDFPFLAARAYIDIPYLAFVVWAAALEAERPRRGTPVLLLLAAASLMRPEAWLLSGLYFLWVAWPAGNRARLRYLVLAGIGPVVWVAVDYAVTGQPLFSLQHTSGLAEELGRQRSLSDVPSATVQFLKNLDKAPVFYAGIVGLGLSAWFAPRRLWMPLGVLVIGLATFVMVGLAGLSVIDRYLLVPSLMVMVFAAVTLGGWSMLRPGPLRTAWIATAVAVVVYGVVFTATHVNLSVFENQLTFRGDAHAALERTLRSAEVRAARRCGPIFTPNHKLIPDSRWVIDAGVDDVLARSDADNRGRLAQGGVALLVTDRTALLRQALVESADDPFDNLPPAGYRGPVATSGYYSAYVRCP
jgi:hypothetical protein